MRRIAFTLLALGLMTASAAAGDGDEAAAKEKNRRPLLIVMNDLADRLWPKFAAPPAEQARRVSIKRGLVGLGSYDVPGGTDRGFGGPPLNVFPRAGLGNSLGRDPNTGRSYWTNMP
ncbi:MAG: hypothetical protein ACHQKZ_04575 [Solirubrobacterales bacterium]|jgi:hypothetical protein